MINHNILHKISMKGFALYPHYLSKLMKPIFKLCYEIITNTGSLYAIGVYELNINLI